MADPKRPYGWMPGFLRRFLNLDYDDAPRYAPRAGGSYQPSASYTPPAPRPASSSPAPGGGMSFTRETGYTPNYPGARPSAPAQVGDPGAPPPPAPRPNGGQPVAPGANLSAADLDGAVQPISYLVRSYARGVLPPQGLESFTKETRATTTDLWNFYNYWFRFQTEDLFRFGREVFGAAFDAVVPGPPAGNSGVRRIRVTVANGNESGNGGSASPVPPPPTPVSAAPEVPPPPAPVNGDADVAPPPAAEDEKA